MCCADYGRILGRNPIWVQVNLTTIIQMFERVKLYTNLGNTKSVTCTPRFVCRNLGKDALTMKEYVRQRQNTVAQYIDTQSLFDLCEESERDPGAQVRMRWWEQEVL